MKNLLKLFPVVLLLMMVSTSGCENSDASSQELAEEVERELERELERARDRVDEAMDRVDEARDRMDEDELARARDDVQRSVLAGIGRIGSALENVSQALEESQDVQPVDWRELDSLLPDDMGRFDRRGSTTGETSGLFGLRFSKAEAVYSDGSDEMNLIVFDLGSFQGLAEEGISHLNAEFDRGDADGFERTNRFGGYPGYQSIERKRDSDDLVGVVVIDNRYLVIAQIEGRNLDDEDLEDVLDDFPFRKLERLDR